MAAADAGRAFGVPFARALSLSEAYSEGDASAAAREKEAEAGRVRAVRGRLLPPAVPEDAATAREAAARDRKMSLAVTSLGVIDMMVEASGKHWQSGLRPYCSFFSSLFPRSAMAREKRSICMWLRRRNLTSATLLKARKKRRGSG